MVDGGKLLRTYNSSIRRLELRGKAQSQLRRVMRFPKGGGVYGDMEDK